MTNSEEIKSLLEPVLPATDFDADFLFAELDSLGVATVLHVLSRSYDISLGAEDVTPRNFRDTGSLAAMVRSKLRLEERIRHFAFVAPDRPALISVRKTAGEGAGKTAGEETGKEAGGGTGVGAVSGPDCREMLTYSELWKAILVKSEELAAGGLGPGRPYVFKAAQDAGFVITYCAVHFLGAVAVPLGAGETGENFLSVREETDSASFPAGTSDVLFTTGTTGKSKGVMIPETYYAACTDNFLSGMPFSEDLLFIISGPLNHIASLLKIYPTLSSGGTLCILDGLKDMNAFFDVFGLPFGKFATFLVPSAIRMLLQFSGERLRALSSKIAFIETGAAPITKADMELLTRTLPDSRLYNTYGGTEIGCAASYDFNDGKYMEGCVGRPLKNCSIDIEDDGSVTVSGRTIMSGYLNDPEGTREVLREGKIHLSDLGHIDEDGLLHLTGRKGDVINVGGYKVNPLEVENAAASFPGVKDSICIAAEHPVIGTVLKLLVQYDPAAAAGLPGSDSAVESAPEAIRPASAEMDSRALARHLKSRLDSHKVPVLYETVPSIRYTYNGKKDRKSYLVRQPLHT